MDDVLKWFKKDKFYFISSIPKIIGKFSNNEQLFNKQLVGDKIDRFNVQFNMIFDYQFKEGGLFMIIGKKK